jgi:hypothetical protein
MAGALRLVPNVFREFFLLENAQRELGSRSAHQETKIRDFVSAADARLAAAESLTGGDQVPAALILYRDGILFTIWALLEAHRRESHEPTLEGAFRSLDALVEAGELRAGPDSFAGVRGLLTDPRPLVFDELPTPEALAKRTEVETIALWLRGLVDARTVRQIKWSRALRIGTVGLALLGVLGFGVTRMIAPKNIALGKPVQMSSRRPQCPPGSGEAGLPPSGLVDGTVSGTYDICTVYEVRPWVTLDLQQSRRISKIVVYDRGDCCWGSYDLPAVLELSEDGTNYHEVARRTTAYSATDPWVVKLDNPSARFVKLRVDANEPRELVLTELEVYAPRF